MSEVKDEIVVIGYRHPFAGFLWQGLFDSFNFDHGGVFAPGVPGGPGATEKEPDEDSDGLPDVTTDLDSSDPNYDEAMEAVEALRQYISDMAEIIDAIPDDASIVMPNGERIYGEELKNAFHNLPWTVGYEAPTEPKPISITRTSNRAGANFGDEVWIDYRDLNGYMALDGGINYLLLHEPAHVTVSASRVQNNNWQFWYESTGQHQYNKVPVARIAYEDEPGFANSERWANEIAYKWSQELNIDILSNPTYGYLTGPK